MARTKIIATLGPASSNPTVIRKMAVAGLDVVRLNFSHGSHQEHLNRIELVRAFNKKYRRHIRFLGDLEGHRIRVGALSSPLELKRAQTLYLTRSHQAKKTASIPFDYTGSFTDIKVGQQVYIDDGTISLIVTGVGKDALKAKVIFGGILRGRKGINMPGARLNFSSLSDKDKEDIRFCVEQKIDFIAQSFVRNKQDMELVRQHICPDALCLLIAKIENREGIAHLDEILTACDGIMIARGDLGVSLPIWEVPVLQKEIIRKCTHKKKFTITATQMLESMTEHSRPTRAEVSDVANAIIDGSDYVMLSAESAVGKYPAEAVEMMNQIIKYTEKYQHRAPVT